MAAIDLKITLLSPLHIGTGTAQESAEQALSFVRDVRGRLCIPASTLKGTHRAATEHIAAGVGLSICNPPTANRMCHPLRGTSACPVCRIFGSPWLPGRIYYTDLVSVAALKVD